MKNLKHFTTTRGTYSNGNYSSFWLDDEFDRQTSIFDDEEDVKPKTDLILSSYRSLSVTSLGLLLNKIYL